VKLAVTVPVHRNPKFIAVSEHSPRVPGVVSKLTSTSKPWIWMLLVVTAVTRHGKLVPTAVRVQAGPIPTSPWPFPKLAPVIVATAALSTVTLNDVWVQAVVVPPPNAGMRNPKLAESILASVVPTGVQLAADATDDNTHAHHVKATPKSNALFLETSFNI
jgi:hypothetical protein